MFYIVTAIVTRVTNISYTKRGYFSSTVKAKILCVASLGASVFYPKNRPFLIVFKTNLSCLRIPDIHSTHNYGNL